MGRNVMKLINYPYGWHFDCTIKGKIVMTEKKWKEVVTDLKRSKKWRLCPDFEKCLFLWDLNRKIDLKDSYLINIRVFWTGVIAYKYKLPRYRHQNYMLQIKK
jgi:hypothetical protein